MIEYRLHFQLVKHKDAKRFCFICRSPNPLDEQGLKEEKAMMFEKMYHTPVRCTKIEKINVKGGDQ